MTAILVSSIQQYTIDRFRVSLSADFYTSRLCQALFSFTDANGNDVTSNLQSITESNDWEYLEETNVFDIILNTNCSLPKGTYHFTLYELDRYCNVSLISYETDITINYMEDIRMVISNVEFLSLDTIHVIFSSLYGDIYQSREMLELMDISIFDDTGTNYSDVFESFSSVLSNFDENEVIKEFEVSLQKGKVLPKGDYTIMLTTRYKSRTFSIIENRFSFPFMTTSPASIGNVFMEISNLGYTNMCVVFDSYLEKTTFDSAKLTVIDPQGNDVTVHFNALRISTTSYSTAGLTYLTRLDIPLFSELYTLEKGNYTVSFSWIDANIPTLSYRFNVDWYLYSVRYIKLTNLDYLTIAFTNPVTKEFLESERYLIEIDGNRVTDEDTLSAFASIQDSNTFEGYDSYSTFRISIRDKSKIKRGTYSFILYHSEIVNGVETLVYDYEANINIVNEITPNISSIYQTDIDKITVVIDKRLPLEVIRFATPHIIDSYSGIDYSSYLLSIEDSNVWTPGQTTANRFDIILSELNVLESGQYTFNLEFGTESLKRVTVFLQYMETRKGFISSVEQIDLSNIRISFSEPQSRMLLLSSKLFVRTKYNENDDDYVDYTDRFELLENVLKDDEYVISELVIPMDHEDSFPSGRYSVGFYYTIEETRDIVTLYSYDTSLGYMTNNIPNITTITRSTDSNGLLTVKVSFGNYLEKELFDLADISFNDMYGRDVLWKFQPRIQWELVKANNTAIVYIKSFTFKILSTNYTIEKGNYSFEFSWKNKINYLPNVTGSADLSYVLPLALEAEVTSNDTGSGAARIYFKFDRIIQYSFFEDLNVEILDTNSQDHTSYFDTIQNSNNINESTPDEDKIPTDNINLDILNTDMLSYGTYQFAFYHNRIILNYLDITIPETSVEDVLTMHYNITDSNGLNITSKFQSISQSNVFVPSVMPTVTTFRIYVDESENFYDGDLDSVTVNLMTSQNVPVSSTHTMEYIGIKESSYLARLDIRSAITPIISSIEQVGINRILVTLKSSVPRRILEEYGCTFESFRNEDVTNKFHTITNSNEWDEEIREVSSFYLRLYGGAKLNAGSYSLRLVSGEIELDQRNCTIEYMEGIECEIKSLEIINLSTLSITFTEEQSVALCNTLTLEIENSDGVDVTDKFQSLPLALEGLNVEYFDTLTLHLTEGSSLARGSYSFRFVRYNANSETILSDYNTTLTYMSTILPLLYKVSATKTTDNRDGLLLWFSPAIERSLFDASYLTMENTSGMSIKDKFEDISEAIFDIEERDNIEYINYVTLTFKTTETLDKDRYVIRLTWLDDFNYLSPIEREVSLDYILFPVESVTVKGIDTLEIKFRTDLTAEYLKNAELVVDSTYVSRNDDGVIITDANFTELFEELSVSNNFDSADTFAKITIKLKNNRTLPPATYRFIIAEKVGEGESTRLRYAYAGTCDVTLMSSVDKIQTTYEVAQTGIDTLEINFGASQNVVVLNKCNVKIDKISSVADSVDYTGYFKSVKESNAFSIQEISNMSSTDTTNVSEEIKDENMRNQYDLSYSGTLTFTSVYQFHRTALVNAKVPEELIDGCLLDKTSVPNELRPACVEEEMKYMLTDYAVIVTNSGKYLSALNGSEFVNPEESFYVDPDTNELYYQYAKKTDNVVDGIHYVSYATDKIFLKLNDNKAIPEGTYKISLNIESNSFLDTEIFTTFMTSTPPEIDGISIEDNNLVVNFLPYAESTTLAESSFSIMTYRGLDNSNNPIGENMTNSFGSVMNSITTELIKSGITYISDIRIPIKQNALLPSGRYKLDWLWTERSYLTNISYIGSLNVVSKGIKTAYVHDQHTIRIIFEDEYTVSYIKGLDLTVTNSLGEDVSDLFMDMESSNTSIQNEDTSDTYSILIEENGEVPTDTYTFTLLLSSEDEGDSTLIDTPVFVFGMNIIFMADRFPSITRIDNLSNQNYEVVTITNDNATELLGKYVQLVTSTTKEVLTESNIASYLQQDTKIFYPVSIDTLDILFSEETHPCLLTACNVAVVNGDGNTVSNYFLDLGSSTSFESRKVLDYIVITMEAAYDEDYIKSLEILVYNQAGENISTMFEDISESNDFDGIARVRTFRVNVGDEPIEEYDINGLTVGIIDRDEHVVTTFSTKFITTNLETTNRAKMRLNDGYTLEPDEYNVIFTYANEPGLDGTVTITPFTYTGRLPFLSTNLGEISNITTRDLSTITIEFSEDLPISVLLEAEIVVLDEDGNDISASFRSLTETNVFDDVTYLSQMSTPMCINLGLLLNSSLPSGKYTFRFDININVGEEDDENDDSGDDATPDDGDEENPPEADPSEIYTMWIYSTTLPYMINETPNSILSVVEADIDTLRVTLENPTDLNMIRKFAFAMQNDNTGTYYDPDIFMSIDDSNNLGRSVLLSDNRYLFYTVDGESWSRLDTGYAFSFNDMIYDKDNDFSLVVCSSGRVLKVDSLNTNSITAYNTGISKVLNSIVKVGSKYIIVGNDGTIIIGTYVNNGFTWRRVDAGTTNTLTDIIAVSTTELFAVGYKGTIIHSTNAGETWEIVSIGTSSNLFAITKFTHAEEVVEEDPDEEDLESGESGDDESEEEPDEPEEDEDSEEGELEERDGIYIVGSNGTIAYSPNGLGNWEYLTSNTRQTLFGITYNGNNIVAVGDAGTILLSTNSQDWTALDTGVSFTVRNVAYCDSKFVASGTNGKWLTSLSGMTWSINSTIFSNTFKNVAYLPSQYDDNRSISYFNVKLDYGEEIGAYGVYTGYVDPTLDNVPASGWRTDEAKSFHVGDVYKLYEIVDGRIVQTKTFQFNLVKTYDEETGSIISTEFMWEEKAVADIHAGKFAAYIIDVDDDIELSEDDEQVDGRLLYYKKSDIDLNYMTSDPGTITKVSLKSPDTMEGTDYQFPYLSVEIDSGNENAIFQASYKILNSSGADVSDYFLPIKQGEIVYNNALNVESISIVGNPNKIMNLPSGSYTFIWNWTTYSDDSTHMTVNIPTLNKFITNVTRDTANTDILHFDLGVRPRLEYFTATDNNVYNAVFAIYKYPTSASVGSTDDYSGEFLTIVDSTSFSNPEYTENGLVKRFDLKLAEGSSLDTGNYVIKLINDQYDLNSYTVINETQVLTEMVVTSTNLKLDQELIKADNLPTINTVKLEMYVNEVEPIETDSNGTMTVDTYSGSGHPNNMPYLANWTLEGEYELRRHVGDIYTNTDTNKTYSFTYDSVTSTYGWELDLEKPHLVITFGNKPRLETVQTMTSSVTFTEGGVNLSQYLNLDILSWDFARTTSNGVTYVSKIRIPIDETINYPGTSNATLNYKWTHTLYNNCIYNDIEVVGISTQAVIRDYGNIASVTPISFGLLTENNETYADVALCVKFEKPQFTDFLRNLDWSIYHETTNADGDTINDDISGYFHSISESNSEWLEDNTLTTDTMYIKLLSNQSIEADRYTLELIGFKSANDLLSTVDDPNMQLQLDMATEGTLAFDTVYKFHADALEVALADELADLSTYERENTIDAYVSNKALIPSGVRNKCVAAEIDYMVNQYSADDGLVKFTFVKDIPWITSNPPTSITASFSPSKAGFSYPVITIGFDTPVAMDALTKFKLEVTKSNGDDYSGVFRKYGSTIIKYYKSSDEEGSELVSSIDIPMFKCKGMKKGTYDVKFTFSKSSLIGTLPSKDDSKVSFTVSKNVISLMGKTTAVAVRKQDKMIVTLKPDATVSTNSKFASSQVAKLFGWKKWSVAIKALSLSAVNGSGAQRASMFKGSPKVVVSNGKIKITYTLKTNSKINPCVLKVGMKYNGYRAFNVKKAEFKGLINNSKASKKDKRCYILVTTHNGVTRKHVYSTYNKAHARVLKLKKLNKANAAQYKKCVQCRKVRILRTPKIKAQIEKYDFPTGRRTKFILKATKKFYNARAKTSGIKCSESEWSATLAGDDNRDSVFCENYVKAGFKYTWKLKIATMATKYPSDGKRVYFAWFVKNGVRLERGYACNKNGKKTKKFKKFVKSLTKLIKNYKKKVSKCSKCKKIPLGYKGSTKITWKNATFPQWIRVHTKSNKQIKTVGTDLCKILNKFYKKAKNGCSKAKFKFVKKNTDRCRLTCGACKTTDKTLEQGTFAAYYKK